jgi:hypothetical protein
LLRQAHETKAGPRSIDPDQRNPSFRPRLDSLAAFSMTGLRQKACGFQSLSALLSRAETARLSYTPYDGLALQLPFLQISESMGNHDSKIVDAASVD